MKTLNYNIIFLIAVLSSNLLFSNSNALRFKIIGNGYSDETIVRLAPNATEGYDGAYDAWKLFSPNPNVPSIYTEATTGQELSINALPKYSIDKSLDIFTNIPVSGNYTIEIEEVFPMDSVYKLSITDFSTGNHYYVSGDTTFNFNLMAQQNAVTFGLNLSTPINITSVAESCYNLNDGGANIDNPGSSNWTCEIQDLNGNVMFNNSSNGSILNYSNLNPGVYTARVSSLGIIDEEQFTVISAPLLTSEFTTDFDTVYLSYGGTVNFTNISQNSLSSEWDFGDGSSSVLIDPSYSYTSIGTYTVTLKSLRNNCFEQSSKTIEVLSSPNTTTSIGLYTDENSKIISKGNGKYTFNTRNNGLKIIQVYNLSGKQVMFENFTAAYFDFSLERFSNGLYIVNILCDGNALLSEKLYK